MDDADDPVQNAAPKSSGRRWGAVGVAALLIGLAAYQSGFFSGGTRTVGDEVRTQQAAANASVDVNIISCDVNDIGEPRATVSVTSRSHSLKDVYIDVGFYDAGGTELASGNTIVTVPAGETAQDQSTTGDSWNSTDTPDCRVLEKNAQDP
jgi:hypothetical protein